MDTTMNTPGGPAPKTAATPTGTTPLRDITNNSVIMKSASFSTPKPVHARRTPQNAEGVTPISSRAAHHGRSSRFGPPRPNPFDTPTFNRLQSSVVSPSIFNEVQSPSNEVATPSRLWNIDQTANLFPAEISDDSPWKQETATSILPPEEESRAQEAISQFFSQTQDLTSPMVNPPVNSTALHGNCSSTNRAFAAISAMDTSNSQEAVGLNNSNNNLAATTANNSSVLSTSAMGTSQAVTVTSQWTQTEMTFPVDLPSDFEAQLKAYFTFQERQDDQPREVINQNAKLEILGNPDCSRSRSRSLERDLSTSRRKLTFFNENSQSWESSDDEDEARRAEPYREMNIHSKEDQQQHQQWRSSPVKELMSMDDSEKESLLSPQPLPLTPIKAEDPSRNRLLTRSSTRVDSVVTRCSSLSPPSHLVLSPTCSPIGPAAKVARTTPEVEDNQRSPVFRRE